jgi:GMP synthase PP-ATPase subunit
MGIELNVLKDGEIVMSLTEHSIIKINFDSNTDFTVGAKLDDITREISFVGKINAASINESPVKVLSDEDAEEEEEVIREIDSVRYLVSWAIIPEFEECYMDATVKINNAKGELVKTEEFKNLFVVSYKEIFNDETGYGELHMLLREKQVKLNGF